MGHSTAFGRISAVALVCAVLFPAAWASAGHVAGSVRLNTPDGKVVNGDWIRVLLTTAAVPVPEVPPLEGLPELERYDHIVSAHMRFYVAYQQHLSQDGYLAASVLTTDNGGFKFFDVPPGRYFIVVTFPSTIGGYKVAWQVPVAVPETGAPPPVSLDWHNMLLPTQRH